ncbi:phytoene desaturase family protein [Kitasatospora sp. NBC_01266]|uniref:phytoene desaturase family protein n=1 Tax=Kitasatospora sp. NBC_01266 TaxID=2903572 RepID=UPI002E372D02|nr:NAD(P)/FAD-dependent oxidoreductase [Kitasatospora sp. NBC_01266]
MTGRPNRRPNRHPVRHREGGRGPDAVVIGTGPNGLAAGVTLARAGLQVELFEAADTIGGGLRTLPLFDSEVLHDICSAVHPMAPASPFFRAFDLAAHGVDLITPTLSYAHPLADGRAALAWRDLATTADALGVDGPAWRDLMEPLIAHSAQVVAFFLSDQRTLPADPTTPLLLAHRILRHGTALAHRQFRTEEAAALLAGTAAHAIGRLPSLAGGAIALLLGHLAHTTGWPLPRGGSAQIAKAMAADITAHGGVIHTGTRITDLGALPPSRVVLADVSPKGLLEIAGANLPHRYARALESFRYGPAAAKVDFLVSDPIPWANPQLRTAGTIHLGGTQRELYAAESSTARGRLPRHPFMLIVDPAVTDPDRARAGRRPVWAYAHVPHGDPANRATLVRETIERYAPGFQDTILAERVVSAAQWEAYNPNYVGGDIGAGAITLRQTFFRPTIRWNPYRTPLPGLYLCSASTPPGPAVHGMPGYLAARSALRREFGIHLPKTAYPAASSPR